MPGENGCDKDRIDYVTKLLETHENLVVRMRLTIYLCYVSSTEFSTLGKEITRLTKKSTAIYSKEQSKNVAVRQNWFI